MLVGLEPIHFKAGEEIFAEGDPPGGVYLIDRGQVEIFKMQAGERVSLARRGFNGVFGEMALVDNKPRSASAVAVEDTWCYMLSKEAFQEHLETIHPFVMGVFKSMSQTIREMTETQTMISNMIDLKNKSS